MGIFSSGHFRYMKSARESRFGQSRSTYSTEFVPLDLLLVSAAETTFVHELG